MRILVIFLLMFIAALAVLVFCMANVRRKRLENQRMQEYLESMEQYIRILRERMDLVRKFRHDLAGHIQTLERLSGDDESLADIQECMENLHRYYQSVGASVCSADPIVNAVCELKEQQCVKRRIPISFHVEQVPYSGIREVDLVGILQNLLDNAIEANERISKENERGISLSMGRRQDAVYIEVENQLSEDETPDLVTRKMPAMEHGIGIIVVRELAEKYSGTLDYRRDTEKNRLFARVTLTAADAEVGIC